MASYYQLTCPNCERRHLKVRSDYIGQLIRCKHCGHHFIARTADVSASFLPIEPRKNVVALPSTAAAEVEELTARLRDALERIDHLEGRLSVVQAELESTREEAGRVAIVERERDEGRDELLRLRPLPTVVQERSAVVERLERELRDSRGELDRLRETSRSDALAAREEERKEALRAREDAEAGWRREREGLAREADQRRAAADAAEKDRRDALESARTARQERDRTGALHDAERAARRDEGQRHSAEIGRLTHALDEARTEAQTSAQRAEELVGQAQALQAQFRRQREADAQEHGAALEALRQRREAEQSEFLAEVEQLQFEIERLRQENSATVKQGEVLSRERDTLAERAEAAETALREAAEEGLREQVRQRARQAEQGKQLAEAQTRLQELGRRVEHLQAEQDGARKTSDEAMAALEQRRADALSRLDEEGRRAERLEAALTATRLQVEAFEQGRAEAERTAEALERRVAEVVQNLNAAVEQNGRLEAETHSLKEELADLAALPRNGNAPAPQEPAEDLSRLLHQTREANGRLRALLDAVGFSLTLSDA